MHTLRLTIKLYYFSKLDYCDDFYSNINISFYTEIIGDFSVLANGVFAGGGNEAAINGGLNLCLSMPSVNNSLDNALTAKLLDNVNLMLRSTGFSEQSTAEIATALTILAK